MTDYYEWGIGYGWVGRYNTESSLGIIACGVSTAIIQGKKTAEGNQREIKYRPEYIVTAFIGPQFLIEKKLYFLPAISSTFGRYYDLHGRTHVGFGFDFRVGLLIPIGDGNNKIDIGAKWCLSNVLSISIPEGWGTGIDLEKIANMAGLYVGYNF